MGRCGEPRNFDSLIHPIRIRNKVHGAVPVREHRHSENEAIPLKKHSITLNEVLFVRELGLAPRVLGTEV